MSKPKGGYRCFAKHPNPSDTLFRWESESAADKKRAFADALNHIEKIRLPAKK